MSLGDKAAALTLAERGMAVNPIEKDAVTGPASIEFFARVAVQAGEADRAITALQKLLSTPYSGPLGPGAPLTPALLRLDPMFDPLRNDPRFQKSSKKRKSQLRRLCPQNRSRCCRLKTSAAIRITLTLLKASRTRS